MKSLNFLPVILFLIFSNQTVDSSDDLISSKNLDILINMPVDCNCTCNCVECEDNQDGCWAYDYNFSGQDGYENCTESQKENHCEGKGAGWIEQHVIDIIPDACDGPPPMVFY